MSILITGGHGHLGSWSAYYLAKAGKDVVLFDINPIAPDYLAEVAHKITFYQGDVLDYARLCRVVAEQNDAIEGIIHTVAVMGPKVPENPLPNVTLNVAGTVNILELAREFAIPKVVYTSTGAVYKPFPGIVSEDTAVQPSDLYGASKASAELIGEHYAKTFGFDFRVCRVYFLYGPGKMPSDFINLYQIAFGVLEGLPNLKMEKGATQKLDFTYIQDAALGTVKLYQGENLKNRVFNIATGQAASIAEVIAIAQKYTHFPVEVVVGPGDLMERAEALDITRSKRELGYQPAFTLEEGIKIYADWIRKIKSQTNN